MSAQRRFGSSTRQTVAQLAARLMAEEGIDSYYLAKRKAAERLGVKGGKSLPDNAEVAVILEEYQRLFFGSAQARWLAEKRKTALAAMQFLSVFSPRLVGAVLAGTAGVHSPVSLHLFTDIHEEVGLLLAERSIPYEVGERRLRPNVRELAGYPCYRFMAGEEAMELVVFPLKDLRQAPLCPVDGKPMRRADQAAVERLVAGEQAGAGSP